MVLGNDQTITIAAQSGSIFELNLMMPVAAFALLESIALLSASAQNLARQSIQGIKATDRGPQMVEQGLMLRYRAGARHRLRRGGEDRQRGASPPGKRCARWRRERTQLSSAELDRVLDPARMTEPGVGTGPAGG